MSAGEITEHAGYIGDGPKLAAYERALKEVVRPGATVLDLGAGTGVLGLLAARAGARTVYAVDSGSIIGVAAEIARRNGMADRIVHIRQQSTLLDLPEPIDVVVCDQIGGLAYDAGVLEYFNDAETRFLAPGGVLVPGSFDLLAAPVAAVSWQESVGVWSAGPAELDLEPMAELAANTEFGVNLTGEEFLAEPAVWASIGATHTDRIEGSVTATVTRSGALNGIVGMFVARLSPSVRLSNSPLHPDRFDRWQNFYPLPAAIDVAEGDQVEITLDVRPKSYLTTWTVAVHRRSEPERPFRHRGSTVLGEFLAPDDLALANGAGIPKPSPAVEADRFALSLIDGKRSEAEIAAAVWQGHGSAFRTRVDVETRIGELLIRHLRSDRQ